MREQVAELRDVGVQHLLCQTGFGAMSHEQNIASMRRFGEQVMPAFRDRSASAIAGAAAVEARPDAPVELVERQALR